MKIVAILTIAYCCQAVLGYKTICGKQTQVCGRACFDPTEDLVCLNDSVVCKLGQSSCGYRCYDEETQDCVEDQICATGHIPCTNFGQYECYDPKSQKCTESGAICKQDEEGCGWYCYSPSEEFCSKQNEICKVGEIACGYQCHDSNDTSKVCLSDGAALCDAGQSACGNRCYDSASGDKCFNDATLCKAGEEACGYECYDPETERCFPDGKVCRSTRIPCGDYGCYWPHNETCYTGRKSYSPSSCPNNQKPCGYDCYDEAGGYTCLSDEYESQYLCQVGAELCERGCHFPSDINKKCIKNKLCKKDDAVCGRRCYNPNKGLVCHDESALCRADQKPCERQCYNPETHKCVDLPDSPWGNDWFDIYDDEIEIR